MRASLRRLSLAAAVALLPMMGGWFVAGPAGAEEVETGSLAFSSDPGDLIGGGQSYSYSTQAGATMNVFNEGNARVGVSVNADTYWVLVLVAPQGQTLVPGVYTGATYGGQAPPGDTPGLNFWGNGRSCSTLTGSFTITDAVFGPYGYVQTLDATFEQHCEGAEAALRGEVHIANPPAPAPLQIGVTVASNGTISMLNGKATLHGTVTCSKATDVQVSGTVTQVIKRVLIKGEYSVGVPCTADAPVAWTAAASPSGTAPFQKGDAEVYTQAYAMDSVYNRLVIIDTTTVVTLDKKG